MDKILNSLVYRTLFYVNIYGSYKLLKTVRFLSHPVYLGSYTFYTFPILRLRIICIYGLNICMPYDSYCIVPESYLAFTYGAPTFSNFRWHIWLLRPNVYRVVNCGISWWKHARLSFLIQCRKLSMWSDLRHSGDDIMETQRHWWTCVTLVDYTSSYVTWV